MKKIRGVKLKAEDINKNTGKDISHTISKIQANERKYTIILIIFFVSLFFVVGYFSLRVNTDGLFNYQVNDEKKYNFISDTDSFSYKIEIITESTMLFFILEESFPFANRSYNVFVALSIFICSGFSTTSE